MTKKGKSKFLREPIRHLNLRELENFFNLVQAFQHTSFQSRNIYKCCEVYRKMLKDPSCVIFIGLSGAMISGGLRWRGLTGCTFEEAKSWGKIDKRSSYASVYMDATVALPLLVGAILQEGKVYRKRNRRQFLWIRERLKSIQWV